MYKKNSKVIIQIQLWNHIIFYFISIMQKITRLFDNLGNITTIPIVSSSLFFHILFFLIIHTTMFQKDILWLTNTTTFILWCIQYFKNETKILRTTVVYVWSMITAVTNCTDGCLLLTCVSINITSHNLSPADFTVCFINLW